MPKNNKIHLLSPAIKILGFKKIKTTLDKITQSNLKLDGDLIKKIEDITKNLNTIIQKGDRLDTKINSGYDEISCNDVDTILNSTKELLENIYSGDNMDDIKGELEIAKEEIEHIKESVKEKKQTPKDLVNSIKVKKEYEKRIKDIELLEGIIKEIEFFKNELLKIIDKYSIEKQIIKKQPNTPTILVIQNKKSQNSKKQKVETKTKTKINIENLAELYEQDNFISLVSNSWDNLKQSEKLEICSFLMGEKDKETLKLFFKASDYNFDKLSEEKQDKFTEIIDFLDPAKKSIDLKKEKVPKPKESKKSKKIVDPKIVDPKIVDPKKEYIIPVISKKKEEPKKIIEIKEKTPEEKFEDKFGYKLNESFFNNLKNKEKANYIKNLVLSNIEDITIYDFVINFITSEESEEFLSNEFLNENQERLGIEVEESEEIEEKKSEEIRKPKVINISNAQKTIKQDTIEQNKVEDEFGNKFIPAQNIIAAGIAAIPSIRGKTKLKKSYEKTHDRGKKIFGKQLEIEKIEISLNHHLTEFKRTDIISEIFIKYINSKKESNLFIEILVNKVINFSDNIIKIFFEELEKLNLNQDFYSKIYLYLSDIDTKNIENKELLLNLLEDKRDPHFELIEEKFEKNINKDEIEAILSQPRINIMDYIIIFEGYNKPEFLLKRYKKQNVTQIIDNTKYDNKTKIEYFRTFREAFIRNFNQFENSNKARNCIRSLERNLIKLGVEQSISEIDDILKEVEKLNKNNEVQEGTTNNENKIEELKPEENKIEITQDKEITEPETPTEKINPSFDLEFLESNQDIEGIMNFLRTFREQISIEDGFLNLLKEISSDTEKQEKLFDLLLIEKSENERNFISYLAYQIGKLSDKNSTIDNKKSDIQNFISELEDKINNLNSIIQEKDKALLDSQKETENLIEVLRKKTFQIEMLTEKLEQLKNQNLDKQTKPAGIAVSIEEGIKLFDEIENLDNDEKIEEKENPKNTETRLKTLMKNKKPRYDTKIEILNLIETFEDLEIFYNKIGGGFNILVSTSKKKGEIEINKAKVLFELLIKKFEELGINNNELTETKSKLVDMILNNLKNNIKKLNGATIPRKNSDKTQKITKPKKHRVIKGKRDMTPKEVEESRNIIFGLENTDSTEEYKEITQIEESLKPKEKNSINKEEVLEKEQNIILQNLGNKGKKIIKKASGNIKAITKTWYNIGIEKLNKIEGAFLDSFSTKLIPLLKKDDLVKFYNSGKIKETNEIKKLIYNRLNSEAFLIDDNFNLYEKLANFMIKQPRTTDDTKYRIRQDLASKKSKLKNK